MDISTKESNNRFLDALDSDIKTASSAVTEFTRMYMREDGFWRKILPPTDVTNDDLDRRLDTDKPMIIVDREVNAPAAISVPYGQLPVNEYIMGDRYAVLFDRIMSPRFTKDVEELRTYHMDIRQVLSDNAIKDILAEEDGKVIGLLNTILLGQNVTIPLTGTAQWVSIAGGITRDNWADAMKVLPRTPMKLVASTVLINSISVYDVCKWGRDEIGGDLAQELLINGYAERQLMGANVAITIKHELVPEGTIYLFAQPKFLGKFFVLEDTTMYIDRKAFMLEFFAYESIGSAIGNLAAVGRVDFTA